MESFTHQALHAMASGDRKFFVELGARIARLRKEHDLTQVQLAEALGIAQQTLAHYEVARLRIPASMLPQLARIFTMGLDELVGTHAKAPARRGPTPRFQKQLELIAQLPRSRQRFVMQILDGVLAQHR